MQGKTECSARLCVTNDTLNDFSGKVKWYLRDVNSRIIKEGEMTVEVPHMSAKYLDEINACEIDPKTHHISYSLEKDGVTISCGSALFTSPKDHKFVDPKLTYTVDGDVITIRAEGYAKWVELDGKDGDIVLEDNFFDMEMGERRVRILSGDISELKLRSVYDVI